MGIVRCQKHGLMGIVFGCPHVADAVRSSTACRGIKELVYTTDDPDLADFSHGCWFCPACIAADRLPPTETVVRAAELDPFLKRTSHLYRPMCPKCFGDWRAMGLA